MSDTAQWVCIIVALMWLAVLTAFQLGLSEIIRKHDDYINEEMG